MGEFAAHTPPVISRLYAYRTPIAFLSASVVLITAAVVVFFQTQRVSEPIQFSQDNRQITASESATLVVDVSGAVNHPGVYTVPVGSRVGDAIALAGGTSIECDTEVMEKMINRASFLTDGMKIYVPKKEYTLSGQSKPLSSGNAIISINTASSAQLESLPGIGSVTAAKIISSRPYGSIEELVSKNVIGSSLLDKLRTSISL